MEDFKPNLTDDADDAERRAADLVWEGLAVLRLEAKIAEVAAARRAWLRRRFWRRAIALGIGLLVLGALAFWILSKKPPTEPTKPTPPEPQIQRQIPDNQPDELLPRPAPTRPQTPIAERPQTPRERAERPLVRGVFAQLDSATSHLLIDLLDLTEKNPPVAAGLEWKKSVQLLREGRPTEATNAIFNFEKQGETAAAEARWLLALALLEQGKVDEAEAIFEKIAQTPKHERQRAAQKALDGLKAN